MDDAVRDRSTPRASTPQLFLDIANNASALAQSELRLARAEVREMAAKTARLIAAFVLAGALMTAAIFLLLRALVDWLIAMRVRAEVADLSVGAAMTFLAALVFYWAWRATSTMDFIPDRTLRQMKRDVEAIKEQAQ
jgi:uncharacterized membrane protein YqjE